MEGKGGKAQLPILPMENETHLRIRYVIAGLGLSSTGKM